MADTLPRLRQNLDFMPSPDPSRPGLIIRDPYHYSDAMLIVPTTLIPALDCFDGEHTSLDLRSDLVRLTGQIQVSEIEKQLHDALDQAGFFDNETYRVLRAAREAEFASQPARASIFAGAAYPQEPYELSTLMQQRIGAANGASSTIAIAAPHVSPDGDGTPTAPRTKLCLRRNPPKTSYLSFSAHRTTAPPTISGSRASLSLLPMAKRRPRYRW